ncbi:MAG: nucleotidyl transferase AbiEii/AbiGii toxin family protein [Solirubrobacteraceae bacterium]|nr:nucleotidyl transferase AbiEii/AbiGii toxin family protein [Solirubrobacteraceae bacterium]
MSSDARLSVGDLLTALIDGDVDFLVVGGIAVQAHGHARTTKDLDVLVRRDPQNYERLAAVMDVIHAAETAEELTGFLTLDPRDPVDLARAGMLAVSTPAGRIDILNRAAGADEFDAMRSRALMLDLQGRAVPVVDLDDLIAMKRAAGREQDRRDIAALIEAAGERPPPGV